VTKLINHDDPRTAQGHTRLDRYWSAIGASDPDLIALTLLTPPELDQLRTGGAAARQSLAAARSKAGGHVSRLP
jgi:hypothetical protein